MSVVEKQPGTIMWWHRVKDMNCKHCHSELESLLYRHKNGVGLRFVRCVNCYCLAIPWGMFGIKFSDKPCAKCYRAMYDEKV